MNLEVLSATRTRARQERKHPPHAAHIALPVHFESRAFRRRFSDYLGSQVMGNPSP